MPTPAGELFEVENLKDLLDLAFEMSYRWSDSNGTTADISYQVAGEEEVEDVACWIMEVSITTEDEGVFTVWVSQADGTAKKIKMEDMEFTGQMAEQLWAGFGVLVIFPFVTGEAWHLYEIPTITDPAYGTLQHMGSQMRTYGETQLTDNEYRFTPGAEWYDSELDHIDYRLSSIDSYMILTYFKFTLENGDWGSFELLTIKLSDRRSIDRSGLAVQLIEVGFIDELGSPHDIFVSGNYAYIADSFNGLRVVDVSDPANPQQVGSFDPPGSRRAQGVYFSDPYLYVADGLGLLILDVSDPTAPFEVGFYHSPGFAVKVYPLGGYAFVADREGGLRIANVSDPANPKPVSNYFEAGSVHVLDVFVSDSYAYVAMGGLGLRIVDISDPANPQEVGFSDTEGVAEAVQVSGSYAYLADGEDNLRIFDISDPADPQEIGFYDTPAPGYAKDVYLSGRYAFVGDGPSSLLLVIDVSDPANPELAGEYETPGFVWAIYITDSHAYVANGELGMLILLLSIA